MGRTRVYGSVNERVAACRQRKRLREEEAARIAEAQRRAVYERERAIRQEAAEIAAGWLAANVAAGCLEVCYPGDDARQGDIARELSRIAASLKRSAW